MQVQAGARINNTQQRRNDEKPKTTAQSCARGWPAILCNGAGVALVDVLVQAGLTTSKGEARRLIKQGGIRLNDMTVSDEAALLRGDDLDAEGSAKLSAGKKKHAVVKAV